MSSPVKMVSQSLFPEWQGIRRRTDPRGKSTVPLNICRDFASVNVKGLANRLQTAMSFIPGFPTLLKFLVLEHNRNLITVDCLPIAGFEQNISQRGILWHCYA